MSRQGQIPSMSLMIRWRENLAMAEQESCLRKFNQPRWLVWLISLFVAVVWLILWFLNRPPAKVSLVGTISSPFLDYWIAKEGNREALILVIDESGRALRVTMRGSKLVYEPVQQFTNAVGVSYGFFDMDKDGYPEFFRAEFDTIWVLKRKESIKGKLNKHQPLPSWFSHPDRSQWVVWAKIGVGDGYCPNLTFITEHNPKQPRKVVAWVKNSSSGGFLFVLSPDGRRLIPFDSGKWNGHDFWREIAMVEDLDRDGICEIIAAGRSYDRTSPGRIGIYKWDGRTYRLWWTSPRKGEYVVDAKICDLDEDGTKEIVAVLDLKGQSNLRALAVYKLTSGRYRKSIQIRLPNEPLPYPDLAEIMPTSQGCIIAIERSNDRILFFRCLKGRLHRLGQVKGVTPVGCSRLGTDLFVSDEFDLRLIGFLLQRVPDKLRLRFMNIFGCGRYSVTNLISWDGKRLRFAGRLRGALWISFKHMQAYELFETFMNGKSSVGKVLGGNWVLLGEAFRWRLKFGMEYPSLFRYRLFFGANGRYREIWQFHLPLVEVYPADLDGDGNDELVFVDNGKNKVQVYRIVQRK